ncbi:RedY protein [Streptomyces smyrnaeus]|uniref:RedY protein n=1 Tax=Streptomyces smyrnaeus TaxID=1387713 RepID=UPI0033B7C703
MNVIVHRIRLRDGVDPAAFERWVRETDYATCPLLPSVLSFTVQRVTDDSSTQFDYFEVISVRSRAEFRRDMEGDTFQGLAAEFEKLATVVDELVGERVEPGYPAT